MLPQIAALGLLTASAAASPVTGGGVPPTVSYSKAFSIRVQLRGTQDLPTPVAGTFLVPVHIGAGLNAAATSKDSTDIAYFVNKTTDDSATWTTNWNAKGKFSYGLHTQKIVGGDDGVVAAQIDIGHTGQQGISVQNRGGVGLYGPDDWMICADDVPNYPGNKANLLRARTSPDVKVPENCVSVKLEPFCSTFPKGAEEDVSHAATVSCVVR